MLTLARAIGILIVTIGTAIALNPMVFKLLLNFWKKGKNIYIAGIVRLVFGAFFLYIASRCRFPAAISILGALMILGGMLLFLIGPDRIKIIFSWWETRPPILMRLMGFIALSIGALIIFSV
jgi:hypothetical protein